MGAVMCCFALMKILLLALGIRERKHGILAASAGSIQGGIVLFHTAFTRSGVIFHICSLKKKNRFI